MTEQDVVVNALNQAGSIIGDYLEGQRDPIVTINRLIEVLDSQALAAATRRMEKGTASRS
jgi:hypothetical protein